MNKEERTFRASATKDWCKDIMKKYLVHWSKDDEIYKNLKQFYDKNHVRGIIYASTSQRKKEAWLSSVAKEINKMYDKIISEEIINA